MDLVVVKIGGKAAAEEASLRGMAAEIAALSDGRRFILVHGGGAEVTELSRRLGLEPVFRDGVRQTSGAEMDVVEMVLAGRVNKHLVRVLRSAGLDPVGLCGSDGGLFSARPVEPATGNRTGEVVAVDRRLPDALLADGFLPVVCPTSFDADWRAMNVNADAVAFSLAVAMRAAALVFLSDVPGVLSGGAGPRGTETPAAVVPDLDAARVRALTASGSLSGGMLPKVTASLEAVAGGVGAVIIGRYDGAGSLARLLSGTGGTRIRS
jgi:acetylglutamate kinase